MGITTERFRFKPLDASFFSRPPLDVGRDLIGKLLVRRLGDEHLTGKIVETEAYGGANDPASHAYRGMTRRNRVMFGRAGLAYVYFIYGNHHCLNVVTDRTGVAGAVLIRALEPVLGIDAMMKNRVREDVKSLCSGPGKLAMALKIGREHNGLDLTVCGELFMAGNPEHGEMHIEGSGRIGVKSAEDRPWRFYQKGNPHVSKK